MDLIFNGAARDTATALVGSVATNNPTQRPTFTLGDQTLVNLYIGDGAGGYDSQSGDATVTPWLAVCTPGAEPTGGTFRVGVSSATSGSLTNAKHYLIGNYVAGDDFTNVGASANETGVIFTKTNGTPTSWANGSTIVEVTNPIDYNATAAALETALEATQAIVGVSVTKSGTAPEWLVQWDTAGAQSTMIGYGDLLTPSSACVISSVRTGTASVTAQQYVRLALQPYALQTTWSTITNGWQARLDLNTRELFDFIDGEAKKLSTLEFQTVDGSGNVRTVAQIECLIRNEGINQESVIPVPLPSYLTAAQARLAFVQNQYAVTGLTGGGTNLDGVATGTTANPTVATNSFVAIVVSSVAYLYQLVSGTDAESSPDVIRPDDYDGSTNARVWKIRDVRIAAHASTHAEGGTDAVTITEAQVTNLVSDLSAKVPLAGGTMTGQLNFSGTNHAGLKLISLTTTQRDALTAAAGMIIYNSTTSKCEKYEGGAWVAFGSGWLSYYRENTTGTGGNPIASGGDSFAIGSEATASYQKTFAIGRESLASNLQACAVGYQAKATGGYSSAFGNGSVSSGSYALAFQGSTCAGNYSVTFSNATTAGSYAFSGPGSANVAGYDYSVSFGYAATTLIRGHLAHNGDASSQHGWLHCTFQTTNNTPAEVLFNGSRLPLANNKAYRYAAEFLFRDATSGNIASYHLKGVVKRGANAAATSLIYDNKDAEVDEDGAFDASASADTTNGTVKFTVTGHATHVVNICVAIYLCEIL
jgi:hypothetical protein